jgi:hypothetical protein
MDEDTSKSLNQLLLALKSLTKTVDKSLMQGMVQGTGDIVVKNYLSLHARAVELLPDDFYVRDVLVLDITPEASDKQKLGQVHLQVSQLTDYLENLVRTEYRININAEMDDMKKLGRDITDQILSLTQKTIRRAISNIEVGTSQPPHPPAPPPGPPPPGAPPWAEPPTPPQPPTPHREDESDTV